MILVLALSLVTLAALCLFPAPSAVVARVRTERR